MKKTLSFLIMLLLIFHISADTVFAETKKPDWDIVFAYGGYFIDGGYNAYINEAQFVGPLDCDEVRIYPCWFIYKGNEKKENEKMVFGV